MLRPSACSLATAPWASTALYVRARSHSVQLTGSSSSSRGSRPLMSWACMICRQTIGAKTAVNIGRTSPIFHGGSVSSTVWPSDSSSAAVSRSASTWLGSTSAPSSGGETVIAIRSPEKICRRSG